ncbi:hypothetical protein V2H45_04440 [Tumidithrix elongata RA019]|uniref:Uncharacterized protein n=1 Tax=Tumidithrix elongata BACA0141 TaxID=2716417 RepID=A0AAW9PZR5_9CYAN|nr:hypothetical protein [Tumidithrix elongata RA019]
MADLQTSQPYLHRQLVSGKLGWGWKQAAKLITANFLLTAGFILLGAIAPILQVNLLELNIALLIFVAFGIVFSRNIAKSVLEACRQNLPYSFPQELVVGGAIFGLSFLVLLGIVSKQSETQILTSPVTIALIASWWVVLAALLIGVALWLWWWSSRGKIAPSKNEATASEHLNVITYSDQTVLISPTSLTQQPRQFNSAVVLVLSLFFWTMVDLPIGIKAILAIAIAASGLTGFSVWQIHLQPLQHILSLRFSGLWGLQANYTIDLRTFSRLAVVKMQESGGEISWMQLSGNDTEITLPTAITANYVKTNEEDEDELGKALREKIQLARHDTTRDSLGLVGVLLPQGAGILAGISLLAIGAASLFLLPLPERMLLEGAVILLGVCLLSPSIAWYALHLVAPNSLVPDTSRQVNHLQIWEIGAAFTLAAIVVPSSSQGTIVLPLLFLACAWLSFGVGACILTLTRRTPIVNKI